MYEEMEGEGGEGRGRGREGKVRGGRAHKGLLMSLGQT